MITGYELNVQNEEQVNRQYGNHHQRTTNAGDLLNRLRSVVFLFLNIQFSSIKGSLIS